MRDFPVFETEFGVAGLVLRDVPYWQNAYIKILSSLDPKKLLKECTDFCKVVGAERIYASGHSALEEYPVFATIVKMQCSVKDLPDTDAVAHLVTEQTLSQWKEIYNNMMASVPNAAYMDDARGRELLAGQDGYLIYRDHTLIGIGKAEGRTIHALASVVPGAGQDVVCALAKILPTETVDLLVARENARAFGLYQRLGFAVCEEISRWYKICECQTIILDKV